MSVKLSKLHYSQEAHKRLMRKHLNDNSIIGITKYHYHGTVEELQRKRGGILPRETRKSIFSKILAGAKRKEFT